MKKTKKKNKISISNKKAFFNYEILDRYIAGIVLLGTEIKSLKMNKASLKDAYCYFNNNELWLKGMHISLYNPAATFNHDPVRVRKLLLHRQELRKLHKKKEVKSFTIVVLRVFVNEKKLAKVEIALARGKKLYDKRRALKEKDLLRRQKVSTTD